MHQTTLWCDLIIMSRVCVCVFCMRDENDHTNYCVFANAILIARRWDNRTVKNWKEKNHFAFSITKNNRWAEPQFLCCCFLLHLLWMWLRSVFGLLFLESAACENLLKRFSEKISGVFFFVQKIMYLMRINVNKMRRRLRTPLEIDRYDWK